ncbi:hypothetical protein WMZ97_08325 [Lentibacillus sp. N15]|uniref:hypothetical protein n=1 Tax=Lentibacillus songyuanensis TaxID=3136161 RepID=UPI0031BB9776
MKRFCLAVLCSLLLILSACSGEQKGDATLKEAALTDFETGLLDMMSDTAFAYDLHLANDNINEIHATVDYYTKGQFNSHVIDFSTKVSSSTDEPFRILFISQQTDDDHIQWISSVISNDGQSTAKSEAIPIKSVMDYASGSNNELDAFPIHKKKIVASLVYSNKKQITVRHDIKTKKDLQQATNYKKVFLITLELQ